MKRTTKSLLPRAYSYIRFSTPEQLKGDSLRRQMEAAEMYAKENHLILDTQLNLKDLGLSAYHGVHRKKGALGMFLKLVQESRIKKGSVLIVESLDRLSREQPMEALNHFIDIIRSGITLVTLSDRQKYTVESLNKNISQLYISIGEMVRANRESARKSELLAAAWKHKREDAMKKGGEKLTARCPAWLELSKDKTKFIKKREACKAVKKIFELRLSGIGPERIERLMNTSNYWKPPKTGKNKTGGWRKSYITKILHSPAVIGEFQFYKLIDGKRQPIGEPIPNYYPPIVSKRDYYKVQKMSEANKALKGNGGGRTGKASNLFTHLVKCAVCGAPMHYVNKGNGTKGGKYLYCSNASRKITENGKLVCTAKPIKYDEFEKLVFDNLEELQASEIFPDNRKAKKQITKLEDERTVKEQGLNTLHNKVVNLTDSIASTTSKDVRKTLEMRLEAVLNEHSKVEKQIEVISQEIEELQTGVKYFDETKNVVSEIYKLLVSPKKEQEKINLKIRLQAEIKKIVQEIRVMPLQQKYQRITKLDDEPGLIMVMPSKYIDHIVIRFKKGSVSQSVKRIIPVKYYIYEEGLVAEAKV